LVPGGSNSAAVFVYQTSAVSVLKISTMRASAERSVKSPWQD